MPCPVIIQFITRNEVTSTSSPSQIPEVGMADMSRYDYEVFDTSMIGKYAVQVAHPFPNDLEV